MIKKIRLQKIIADSGYCSRRKAEAYIQSGLVQVNGRPVKIGDHASPKDIITIRKSDTSPWQKINTRTGRSQLRYIKLYKPRGYLCSMSDPHADSKKLITELTKQIPERVYPVGRLDANSEGLILLTNDGDFANKVTHPSNLVKKVYRVTVSGKATEDQVADLSAGVDIGRDGKREMTQPCVVDIDVLEERRTVLLIAISEGKNRQIRRMCEAVGLTVSRLKRISIAGVKLGQLRPGEHADLTSQELKLLCGG
jgi:23S rRNA pseudouridine2605 synthase